VTPDESPTAQETIAAALLAEVGGAGLRVRRPAGLAGACVEGATVDAYVVATAAGLQVELWHADADDPFAVERGADLATAVNRAVAAASGTGEPPRPLGQ
jgi:hypothetical protein